jgi:hypothetical protein
MVVAINTIAAGDRALAEKHARQTLEHRLGRSLSDQEWASYKSSLVAFFQLLLSWEASPSS